MMIHRRLFVLTQGVCGRLALLIFAGLLIAATFIGQGVLTAQVIGQVFRGAPWQASLPFVAIIVVLVLVHAALQWFESLGAKPMVVVIKLAELQ